jgi:hypothetical protein
LVAVALMGVLCATALACNELLGNHRLTVADAGRTTGTVLQVTPK